MAVSTLSNAVPARFLVLVAHFVLAFSLLYTRERNVDAGLPYHYSALQKEDLEIGYIAMLAITLSAIAFEVLGFLLGVSTLSSWSSLVSLVCHCGGCIASTFFVWDEWNADAYLWILCLSVLPPALLELGLFIRVFALKKY